MYSIIITISYTKNMLDIYEQDKKNEYLIGPKCRNYTVNGVNYLWRIEINNLLEQYRTIELNIKIKF